MQGTARIYKMDSKLDEQSLLAAMYKALNSGDAAKVIECGEKGAARYPFNKIFYFFLSLGYTQLQLKEKAIKTMKTAEEKFPGSHECAYYMGKIYESFGDLEEAEYYYTVSLHATPDEDTIMEAVCLFDLGVVALKGRNYSRAREMWIQSMKKDPDNKEAKECFRVIFGEGERMFEAGGNMDRNLFSVIQMEKYWEGKKGEYYDYKESGEANRLINEYWVKNFEEKDYNLERLTIRQKTDLFYSIEIQF